MTRRYAMLYRPMSFCTLPRGLQWTLVERPGVGDYSNRTDLPFSTRPFGVFECEPLTEEQLERFEIEEVQS
jgi:hypothetical protein